MHYRLSMRTLSLFVAAILGTLLLTAVLIYPVYGLVHVANPAWPFHKIASRLWLVFVVLATIRLGRALQLSRADWGYGVPRAVFLRHLGSGFVLGLLSMLPVAWMLIALGVRPLAAVGHARLLHLVWSGLLSGFAVGFVEETLFRGLLQGAVLRDIGADRRARVFGLVLVALFYSGLHFLARITIPPGEVDALSGLRLLTAVGDDFLHFGRIADSFAALVSVGLLLSAVRLYTGSIALGVGLHAGWVTVMRIVIGATARPMDAPFAWLASTSDGFTGWLVFAWTTAILVLLVAAGRVPGMAPATHGATR